MRPASTLITLITCLASLPSSAAAAPYLVRGQVVTAEGGLVGAEVRLFHHPPSYFVWSLDEPERRVLEPIETASDEHGRFEIAVDLEGIAAHEARWLLEVSAPGLARRILEVPPSGHNAHAGTTEELGGILLSPGVVVRGRVVAAADSETPVAGVRVALWHLGGGTPRPWTATTGEDGSFAVPDVPPGEYSAVLDRPGFAPRHLRQLRIQTGPASDLGTVALEHALALRGRVIDAAGKPIAGVRVLFRHDLPPAAGDWLPVQETETDPAGEFRLAEIPPALPAYSFRFKKPGYRWRGAGIGVELELATGGPRLAAPITLTEAKVLAGRVTDPASQPIVGAFVTTVPGSTIHRTGDDGSFRIEHIAGATGRVHVRARGYLTAEVEIAASPEVGAARQPASIVLEPAVTTDLTLTVRDARGRPIAGAEIIFRRHDEKRGYQDTGLTDDDGTRQLDRVPPGGPCSLQVRHPEYPKWSRSDLVVEAGQQSLTVDLDPAPWQLVTVRGRVIDGEDAEGRPIPGAEVNLGEPYRSPHYRARAGSDGGFELRRVREGAYRLIATAPGRAPAKLAVNATTGLDPLEVALDAGATLRGTIGGVEPAALAEMRVAVVATGMSQWLHGRLDGNRYRIDHLGVGRWSVALEAGAARIDAEVEIEPGQTEAWQDFVLPAGHRVSGQLLIDGRPPPPTVVFLKTDQEARVSGHHDTKLDAGGRFVFDHVAAGPYHLEYLDRTGSLRHATTVAADVELFLDVATVPLHGRLVDAANGTGIAEVAVKAHPQVTRSHGPRWESVSDSAGWFDFGRVLPGSWTLFAKPPGFLEQRLQVAAGAITEPPVLELVASEGLHIRVETSAALPHSVELQLRDAGGERVAHGHVTLAGNPEGHWSEAPRGRYRLWASNDVSLIAADVEIPGPVVILTFPPAGALRLRVPELELESEVPWRTSVPVQVAATLELPDDPAFDGRWQHRSRFLRLKSLTPGLWRIEVRTEDGRIWTGNAQVLDGRSSEVLLAPH